MRGTLLGHVAIKYNIGGLLGTLAPFNPIHIIFNGSTGILHRFSDSLYHFPHSPFFSACLSTFSIACSSFPLVFLGCQIPIAFHPICPHCFALPVLSLQLLQSGILFLLPSKYLPALIPSAITSRHTIFSKPSNLLSAFLLHLRFVLG